MKNIQIKSLLIAIIAMTSVFSCENENLHKVAAQQLCDCQKPMVDKLNSVLDLKSSGKIVSEEMLESFDQVMDQASECMDAAMKPFGDEFDFQDEEKITEAMNELCPQIEKDLRKLEDL